MFTRLRRDDGFALVTAILVVAVMMVLLVVVLTAGQSTFEVTEQNSRFTRSLGVAEAGANAAVTMLGESRTASNPCPIDDLTKPPCIAPEGEYRMKWEIQSGGSIVVTATGYYPNEAQARAGRQVQVTLSPEATFRYALYSASTLDIKNDEVVLGDVFANQKITLGTNAVVCGSILNASGGVETQNGASVVKTYGTCSGKNGQVWAGGPIVLGSTGLVEGDATAAAPSSTLCPSESGNLYAITGGTVLGTATACGPITASTPNFPAAPFSATAAPPITPLPTFTFDPANYPGLVCYPTGATCAQATTSATAVSSFAAVSRSNMNGAYAIWQTQPTKNTTISLDGLSLDGDLTIVTNAPIDFGNTSTVSSTVPATLVIISLYVPPTGTNCEVNGGDCSIYAKNQVVFSTGDPADPDDGIAVLLYTPGKMAFKNTGGDSNGEGALYAGSMDLKNGFEIEYNTRIERVLGFGVGLEQVLWQEIPD